MCRCRFHVGGLLFPYLSPFNRDASNPEKSRCAVLGAPWKPPHSRTGRFKAKSHMVHPQSSPSWSEWSVQVGKTERSQNFLDELWVILRGRVAENDSRAGAQLGWRGLHLWIFCMSGINKTLLKQQNPYSVQRPQAQCNMRLLLCSVPFIRLYWTGSKQSMCFVSFNSRYICKQTCIPKIIKSYVCIPPSHPPISPPSKPLLSK